MDGTIRILDAGCGNGKLISYLHRSLHVLHPDKIFHLSGFDVYDHGVQSEGFIQRAVDSLSSSVPNIDWVSRIYSIQATDGWSFGTEKFDIIVSNQVMEHVHDKDHFFSNVRANLADGGYSLHLAPLRHIIHEGHIYLPWAHRLKNFDLLYGYIRLMSTLGLGKFKGHHRATGCSLREFSERHADYMYFWTSYSSESETLHFARKNGLRADFRFSLEFFSSKLRQVFRRPPRYTYTFREFGLMDAVLVKILRYLSSVTLVCRKKNIY